MRRTALVVTLAALVGALVAVPIAVYASHSSPMFPTRTRSMLTSTGWLMPV